MVKLALHSIAYEAKTLNLAKAGYTAFYVDAATGSDAHDGGSWGQAFKTIQNAVDEAESWCKIFIKSGTYAESVSITSKDGISLIGENRSTTIIKPPSSYGIKVDSTGCFVSTLTSIGYTVGIGAALYITGNEFSADNLIIGNQNGPAGILAGKGIYGDSEYSRYSNILIDQTYKPTYGIHLDANNIEVHGCIFENVLTDAILIGSSNWSKIYDNTLVGAGGMGCRITGIADYNIIYHNNFISSAVTDGTVGKVNTFKENFYDVHTTDSNTDGLCDTPYSFTGNVDYQPVSQRNGWKQLSLGYASDIVAASGTSTLNDANTSDTVIPPTLPTKIHAIFDISNLNNNLDDFTLEVKVGVSGSERVVAYYKLTSDGTDITVDKGSGIGAVVKQRKIDISDILVYTGEQALLNYTKNGATDRNVTYKYACGV